MKKIEVIPNTSVGKVAFGCDREIVRSVFGKKYKEIKKNSLSKNTMDVYDDFHLFYSKDNEFEAIELFGKIQVVIDGEIVYPGKIDRIKKLFPNISFDGYGWIDKSNSLSIVASQDDENVIGSILFGKTNYYK